MVMTTFLFDHDLNKPSGYPVLDETLKEVRERTGEDWQIIRIQTVDKRLFSKDRVIDDVRLYKYVGGVGPWQCIGVAHCPKTIYAYLMGLLSGLDKADRSG